MADFNITALIGADVKNFKDGMRDAKKSLADLKKEAGKTMAEVGDALAKGGKAMTTGITLPVVAGVAGAIKSFADLEQILGGVEKLFGDSANAVIRNSESAYRRAGVSGVDYMEQVTSFSATLLQGLGGDTVKAAEYADKAIVDMADNANTFGTNIGDIQNAYQGFAKDNYSMLDNLRLGFGGTAGEMARLINESGIMGESFEATAENVKDIPFDQLIEAIHVTQTEMGITGTTAKEAAETVSGSFDTMVAAGKNLVAGLGDSNADVEVMFEVLGETIEIFVGNVKGVLQTIWDNLPIEDWQKWLGVIAVAIGPVMWALGSLIGGVKKAKETFELLGDVFDLMKSPTGLIIMAIIALAAGLVYLWNTNEEFRNKIIEIWDAIVAFLIPIIDSIKTFIMDTWNAISTWWAENQEGIKNTILNAWNGIVEFLMPLIQAIADFIRTTWETISAWWAENQESIKSTVSTVWEAIKSIFDSVLTLISEIVERVLTNIKNFWDEWGTTIMTIVGAAWETIKFIFDTTLTTILNIVEGVIEQIEITFQFAMDFINGVVDAALAIMEGDWDGVLSAIEGIVESFKTFVGDTFDNLMETAKEYVEDGIEAIEDFFESLSEIDLWEAGKAIIDGFLGGLQAAYESVKEFIGGIAGWIAKNKGPISYDKKLLIDNGEAIMEGLNRGLMDKFKEVKTNVSSMAGVMSAAFSDADSMGGRLNAALSSSVSGGYAMTANGQLSISQQPAYINLTLGGHNYSVFVDDISNAQNQSVQLELAYL